MKTKITGTGISIPAKKIDNEELSSFMDTSDEWIRSHTGIGSRHIAGDDIATSDLAIEASHQALKSAGIKAEQVDLIIVATATPDYLGFPSTACIVQGALGAENAAAFDLVAGCTGFIYGLDAADAMLRNRSFNNTGNKYALVIGSEILSHKVDWNDRNTAVLFGDGAGAVVLENRENLDDSEESLGLVGSILKSDGTGFEALIVPKGGSRNPYKNGELVGSGSFIEMDGRKVYNFAVRVNTLLVKELLIKQGLTMEDIKWIVPHQANSRILQAVAKRIGFSQEKIFMNIEKYANTSAASIPIALNELLSSGQLQRGDWIMMLGFGAGLSYGGNLIQW